MRGAEHQGAGTLPYRLRAVAVALLTLATLAAPAGAAHAAAAPKTPPTPSPTQTAASTTPPRSPAAADKTAPGTGPSASKSTGPAPAGPPPAPPKLSPAQQAAQDRYQAESAARSKAKSTGKAVPVDAATTETTTVTANPDGTFTASTALNPVRVKQNGAWTAIDPALAVAADGSVRPKATSLGMVFSGGGDAPLAVVDDHKGHVLTITWPTALPKPAVDGSSATYANVFPGVDLRMTAGATTYSELLIVHDAKAAANPALRTVRLGMSGPGLTVATDASGAVLVTDAAGTRVFGSPQPTMWDSSPAAPATKSASQPPAPGMPSHYSAMPTKAVPGGIEISPDQRLLSAPDTRFPVVIDPAEGIPPGYWAELWSCSAWKQLNFIGIDSVQNINYPGGGTNTDVVRAGYYPGGSCPGPVRTMLQFDTARYVDEGDNINSANLDLYEQYPGPNCFATDVWTADPISYPGYPSPSWYNTATVDGFYQGSKLGVGNCLGGTYQHVEFNVGAYLGNQVRVGNVNTTFGLRTESESSGTFEAFFVQNNGAYNPLLNVNFNMPPTFGVVTMDSTNGYLPKLPGANPTYGIHASVQDTEPGHTFRVEFNTGNGTGWPASVIGTATASNADRTATVSADVPASYFQDGASYTIWARVTDLTSGLQAVLQPPYRFTYTAAFSPPSQPSITSATNSAAGNALYFPPSATGQQATVGAGTPVTNAFHLASTLTHANAPNVQYFDYVVNGDSSQAGPNTCNRPTQCGRQFAASSNDAYVTINSAITHAGMNSLFVKAVDMAGNTSWNTEYDFFVPASFVPTIWGSVIGDQIPDIMAIAPTDPTTPGSPSHLVTFPTNLDPSKSVTQGWAGNWIESAPATNAPDGVSWAGTLITHRGASRVQPYDDLFAWKNGQLYYYYNTLMSTSNPSHSPVDAFAKTQETVITRPVCTTCGPTYAGDWSKVQQILALGPAAGGVPGTMSGKTSLITVEDDGHQGANLWLFDPAGVGQLRNPRLIASCSILIPGQAPCPAGWNWAQTTLVAPGNAAGHPAGADGKATSGLPDLWARDNNTGTLYMFVNRLANGAEDPTGLGDFATRVQLGGPHQFDARTYPSLFSNGNIEQGGNGSPDLWTLTPNGQLNLVQSPSNTHGNPIPDSNMQTVSSAGWAGSYSLSAVDTATLNAAAGALTLAPQTGAQVCLDVAGGSSANGTGVQTWSCDGLVNQAWTLASDGTVRWMGSTNAKGAYDKCLDVKADSTTNYGTFLSTPVQLWDCNTAVNNGGNQKWQIRLDPSGKGSLYNPESGMCLDDPNSTSGSGTQFQIWNCWDSNSAQLWTFPGTVGSNLGTEAENLRIEPNPTIAPSVQGNCCNVTWSNGRQLLFPATASGSTFAVDYYVPIAGTYVVAPVMTKAPDYGTVQLSVDGQPPLPNTLDGYNPTVTTTTYRFGATKLTVGYHKFTFTVTGTNPASVNKRYMAGIDTLNLNWTTDTNPYLSVKFPTSGLAGLGLTIDASGSLGGGSSITGYSFDFGDGSAPTTGTAAKAGHTYSTPGTYTMTVTATDAANASSTMVRTLVVGAGPSSQWKLSEGGGTTAADSGISAAFPATLSGGASLAPGGYGTFNGSGYAATASAAIDTTKSFTVSAWVYLDRLTNFQTILTQQGSQTGGFHLEFQNADSQGTMWSFGRSTSDTANSALVYAHSAAGVPKAETWTHLIGSWDAATGVMSLYVNGQLVGTAVDTSPIASTGPLVIGRGWYNGTANNYVGGGIADVRAYQQAFGDDLASWLYQNTGFTPPTGLTYAVAAPGTLYSNDGSGNQACSTDPAHPVISTITQPGLVATTNGLAADFEMRDVTDPNVVPPLYYGGSGSSAPAAASPQVTSPVLANGHRYAFAARAKDGSGRISASSALCYLRVSVGGQAATPATGAVGAFFDNTVYPASAGPISWSGPVTTLVWQKDGNLVLYKKNGQPIWDSGTEDNPGATLALQNDGNLVIRPAMPLMDATGWLYGGSIWSSATSGKNVFDLVEQTDGNVVLYAPTGPVFGMSGNAETFANAATHNCLDSSNGSVYTGACNGGSYQHWIISPHSDGTWSLQDSASGQCLDGNGTSLYAGTCNGGDYQRWYPTWGSSGWILKHKQSGLVLDSQSDGTPYFNTQNGGAYQQWG